MHKVAFTCIHDCNDVPLSVTSAAAQQTLVFARGQGRTMLKVSETALSFMHGPTGQTMGSISVHE